MTQPSRMELLTAVETLPRQTQKTDFSDLLTQAMGNVVDQAGAMVRGIVGAVPALSTAVAGIQSVAGSSTGAPRTVTVAGSGIGSSATDVLGGINLGGNLQSVLQRLQGGGDLTSSEYLVVQQAIQQESQQYTAVSNILKVRSDSAHAAINNIR